VPPSRLIILSAASGSRWTSSAIVLSVLNRKCVRSCALQRAQMRRGELRLELGGSHHSLTKQGGVSYHERDGDDAK